MSGFTEHIRTASDISGASLPQVGERVAFDFLTQQLMELDSSVSGRSAIRSSEAETIGNARADKQAARTRTRERGTVFAVPRRS